MQDDFTLVNADVNRDKCMRLLLDSALRADCESIQGKYNVYELLQRRRAVVTTLCVCVCARARVSSRACVRSGGRTGGRSCLVPYLRN
jgi:hypothetical protein